MRRRVLDLAVAAWIGALLVTPVVALALGVRGKNVENRGLVKGPTLTATTLLHGSAWRQFADAFSDHLPWRDRAIRLRAEVGFDVFGDSPHPGTIIVGRKQWLFLDDEFTECLTYPHVGPRDVAQAFSLADAVTVASGRQFRGVVVPAKSTIEADHYRTTHYAFERCARTREQNLAKLLRGAPGMVDLWPVFRAAKRRGRDVFAQTDSHTGTYGSILIARTLVRSLRPGGWQPGLEALGPTFPYVGDLTVYGGIDLVVPRHRLVVRNAPRRPLREPVLELTDSQLREADPETRPYLPDRQLVDIDQLQPGLVPTAQIRAARVIVVESVVRLTYRRVAQGFPDALVDALAPDVSVAGAGVRTSQSAGTSTIRVAKDDVHDWRLLVVDVSKAATGGVSFALSVRGRPLTSPDSRRTGVEAGRTVALAVPPGMPLNAVRLSVTGPGAAHVSAPRVAFLGP